MKREKNCHLTNPTAHRLPPPSNQLKSIPGPSSPRLRIFRHPVLTSKGRITLSDQYDQIIKAPKPIPPKNTSQSAIILPATKEPAKDTDKKKTINPINKEKSIQTTAEQNEQVTQTELILTDDDMHIFNMVKSTGLTREEVQDFRENYKKEKKKTSDDELIDLENNYEDDVNVLDKIVNLLPPPEPPSKLPAASSAEQHPLAAAGVTAETLKSPFNPKNNDIQNAFRFSYLLLQAANRIVQIKPGRRNATETQIEDKNKKRRLNSTADTSTNEVANPSKQNVQRPTLVAMRPSTQDVPERQAQLSSMMPPQHAQNASTRNHHINNAAYCAAYNSLNNYQTQQIQVQRPSQMHPNDPRRPRGFNNQVPIIGHPHLGTYYEANMYTEAQQYYYRHGNIYPQRN